MTDLPLATLGKPVRSGYRVHCWRCHAPLGILTAGRFVASKHRGSPLTSTSGESVQCRNCPQVNRVSPEILR